MNAPYAMGISSHVRLDLAGYGVGESLVSLGGYYAKADKPFPILELFIDLELDALRDGGLKDLLKQREMEGKI